jgi:hypothetical protein
MNHRPIVSQQVTAASCPGCSKVLDGATGEGDPSPGAFTVCAYCFTVSEFTEDLQLRRLEAEELEALEPEMREKLDRFRAAAMEFDRGRRIMDRLHKVDGTVPAELARKLATGDAVLVGPLQSSGKPPRKMRPAVGRRCSECRRPIWLSAVAPAGRAMCHDCAIGALDQAARGDS